MLLYLDARTFRLLSTSLVRPHLEYANAVWNPYEMKHIDMIENVQRRATKLEPGLNTLDYENRLRELNLPTLSYRRMRDVMIEVYKILASSRENLSSGFPTNRVSNQSPQLQRLARKLNFRS